MQVAWAQNHLLPLFDIEGLKYVGAFRIPAEDQGSSDMNYSEGPIAYNATNHSLFMVGHSHDQEIAEFRIPELNNSSELAELKMAENLQPFATHLNQTTSGNPQGLDRIGGMIKVDDQLIINAYEYYDAPGDNTLTTLINRTASNLSQGIKDGYFEFVGGAGHTSGWISPIPDHWQEDLGGTHLTGQSSGIPITSRTSVGPSAFSFDVAELMNATGLDPIFTTRLMDFSLSNPLHDDLPNAGGNNDLWTHLSRVTFGMIVPNSRTYLTIGHSGGHRSGVCYKCTQNDGHQCGGYCPPEADDRYQYYWLWDLNDLMDVKHGLIHPYEVRPYDLGVFKTPFEASIQQIGGGSFDPNSGQLYLTILRADRAQGIYANPPVVTVFAFDKTTKTEQLLPRSSMMYIQPNPTIDQIDVSLFLPTQHTSN